MAFVPNRVRHSQDNAFGIPLLIRELQEEPKLWLICSGIQILLGQTIAYIIEAVTNAYAQGVFGINDEHADYWFKTMPVSLPLNFASDLLELWMALGLFHIALLRLSGKSAEIADMFKPPVPFRYAFALCFYAAIPWWASWGVFAPSMVDDNLVVGILILTFTAWALVGPLFAFTPVVLMYLQTTPRRALFKSVELVSFEPIRAYGIVWGTYLISFIGVIFCLLGWVVTNPVIYLGLAAWVVDRVDVQGNTRVP